MAQRFRSVVLDVDSTLSAIEGIDWLAARRGEAMRAQVAEATDRAMRGEISVADVYGRRLDAVAPSREEVAELGRAYVACAQPGARESLAKLTNSGVRVVLVTAALRDAVLPLARHLGLSDSDVNAVAVYFTPDGKYSGFDSNSPLCRNRGKAEVVRTLGLDKPVLGVGDGITDLEIKTTEPPAVDAFAAYTGVIERPPVVRAADYVIRAFDELPAIVLG